MRLLLLATLAHAFDDWEYTANELRVPSPAQAPVAFVGTVKSWKPVYLGPHMKSAREPNGSCNTEYVLTVDQVVRGPIVAGSDFTLLWGGCKLEDGRVASMIAGAPAPPPSASSCSCS